MPAALRLALLSLAVLAVACPRPRPTPDAVDVLVLAPHPDDEVLLAGGVLQRAVAQGQRVAVVLMTNGDYTCERDGYRREAETVAALASLGVSANAVHFLGYPDGELSKLGEQPLDQVEHLNATGQCVERSTTYADRAAGRIDEHTRRTGAPGEWTAPNLTQDLAALLVRLAPRHVYLPHAIDDHPDHAATYLSFRRALDLVPEAPTTVHRGVVHAGRCWPSACEGYVLLDAPLPALPAPLERYLPDEHVPADARAKLAAIALYTSQTEGPVEQSWLASFARPEEAFFTERYERQGTRWVMRGASEAASGESVLAHGPYEEWNQWGAAGFEAAGVRLRVAQ